MTTKHPCAAMLAATATLLAASTTACKSRTFNANASRASSATTPVAGGQAFLPPLVDASLLVDDSAHPPSTEPPADFLTDAVVVSLDKTSGTRTQMYFSLRDSKGDPVDEASLDSYVAQPFDVRAREASLKASKPSAASGGAAAPVPLAAASVLEILRRNRKEFALVGEGGQTQVPNVLGLRDAFGKGVSSRYVVVVDPAKPFSSTPCSTFDPESYSDVKWVYYCSISAMPRACHRTLIGVQFSVDLATLDPKASEAERARRLREFAKADYESVKSYCLDPKAFPAGAQKKNYDKIIENSEGGIGAPLGSIVKAFQAFYPSQEVTLPGGAKVNMFDYIMKSEVYAFDYAQQQAVLNAYFGELKPAAEGAFDPKSPADCQKYREPRMMMDIAGRHCDPDAGKKRPFVSNGR